jgi:hypothetical protein
MPSRKIDPKPCQVGYLAECRGFLRELRGRLQEFGRAGQNHVLGY